RRGVARDDRGIVFSLHVNGGVGQVLHDLREQLAGNDGAALTLHKRGGGVLDGQFEVGSLQGERIVFRIEVDAREDGQRRSRGDAFENDGECVLQLRLVDAEFQRWF